MGLELSKKERTILFGILGVFLVWSIGFIYRSSFTAVDGRRYFCLFDDAMISMRYGWNLAQGNGLVWNPGERVQGYTNLLMTLLMAVIQAFFEERISVLLIQLLGVGFMAASAFIAVQIGDLVADYESEGQRLLIRTLIFFTALAFYPLTYWSLMGMETGLLTVFVLLSVRSAFSYLKTNRAAELYALALYTGAAFLTRNDSIVFAALIGAFVVWELFREGSLKKHLRPVAAAGLIALGIAAGQFIFQYAYYGEFLPNTWTLKISGMPLELRIENGLAFLQPFLVEYSIILGLAVISVLLRFRSRKFLLFAVFGSAIGYQIYAGGDPWPYWRMISPALPLAGILIVTGLFDIESRIKARRRAAAFSGPQKSSRGTFPVQPFLVSVLLFGLFVANFRSLPQILLVKKPYSATANENTVNIALMIQEITTTDATVGVLWAGAIPYYSQRTAVDFLGKNDRYIANLPPDLSGSVSWHGMSSIPGHNKYDLNYSIKTLQPTYIQLYKWGQQDLSDWIAERYVRVEVQGVSLFLLKDSPEVYWDEINLP